MVTNKELAARNPYHVPVKNWQELKKAKAAPRPENVGVDSWVIDDVRIFGFTNKEQAQRFAEAVNSELVEQR